MRRSALHRSTVRLALAATAAALSLAVAGCAGSAGGGSTTAASTSEGYLTPGKITIATGDPAYFPYVIDDDPTTGDGFEAAVAYAVADKLGFAKDDVVWVRTTFDAAIAPGPKDFDLNLQQFTITPDREQNVDFSSSYYETSQAVVTTKGSKADGVTSIAGLKGLLLGAAVGTTSADTIDEAIAPTTAAALYNSNDDAVLALQSGQVDAIVVDLPTAYYMTGVQLDDGVIVGQLPAAGVPDEWGILLGKDSPLTQRVTDAVDALRTSGTLDQITDKWLGAGAGVSLLK